MVERGNLRKMRKRMLATVCTAAALSGAVSAGFGLAAAVLSEPPRDEVATAIAAVARGIVPNDVRPAGAGSAQAHGNNDARLASSSIR